MNKDRKAELNKALYNKLGKIDHVKGAKMLKELTRKKYRVATNANAWKKRGCYYTGPDTDRK